MTQTITAKEYRAMAKKPKRNKYGAKRVEIDGIKFDSKKEAAKYGILKALQDMGLISELTVHPVFPLYVNDHHICDYVADFFYWEGGMQRVVDVKSPITAEFPLFKLKCKLMKAIFNIEVEIV